MTETTKTTKTTAKSPITLTAKRYAEDTYAVVVTDADRVLLDTPAVHSWEAACATAWEWANKSGREVDALNSLPRPGTAAFAVASR